MYYLVRMGPPPSEMMTADGFYDVKFTDFAYFSEESINAAQDPKYNQHEDKLIPIVEQMWLSATGQGFGHILVGTCDQFVWEGGVGNKEVVKDFEKLNPKNYKRLFAVATTSRVTPVEAKDAGGKLLSTDYAFIDISLDYRDAEPKPEVWIMRKAGEPQGGDQTQRPPRDSPNEPSGS